MNDNLFMATAFRVSNAPCVVPAARVKNMRAGSLRMKFPLHIGCWNVRTLIDTGSQSSTMRSLFDYRVDIACLSETSFPCFGERKVKVPVEESSY